MKIKTEELIGAALDWAVAKCESTLPPSYDDWTQRWPRYSTDWALGGPIIERESMCVISWGAAWDAHMSSGPTAARRVYGPTPLVAAMRCFVARKLGYDVEVPDEVA